MKDHKDDMFLELAVESESDFIITFNNRDYEGTEQRAKRASKKKFKKVLNKVSNVEPEEYDK